MKKVLRKVGRFFGWILAVLLVFVSAVVFLILIPIDYIKYKTSLYYKKERKRYRLFAASGEYFEIYNEVLKNELPINYVPCPGEEALERGWFVFEDILIIPSDFSFEYDEEGQKWHYCCYEEADRTVIALDEYIESAIRYANKCAGKTICSSAVVLIDGNDVKRFELAKNEKSFLIYTESKGTALKEFCNKCK